VIAAHDRRKNLGALDRGAQLRRDQHVVDSPSDVPRPRIGKVAPPRIMPIALREQPESVDESGIDKSLESRLLFVGESLLAAIRLRIRKIKLSVRDIQVTAKNDGLGFFQLFAIREKSRIPMLVPQSEPAQVILGIRRIHGDDEELGDEEPDNEEPDDEELGDEEPDNEEPDDEELKWVGNISTAFLERWKRDARTGQAKKYGKRVVSYMLLMRISLTNWYVIGSSYCSQYQVQTERLYEHHARR